VNCKNKKEIKDRTERDIGGNKGGIKEKKKINAKRISIRTEFYASLFNDCLSNVKAIYL
jgi:hypothetical protein